MINFWRILSILAVGFISPLSEAGNLGAALSPILTKQNQSITTAMMVMDAHTGKTLYEYHALQVLSPASNTKLFSAAAALYGLGPQFQFTTSLKGKIDTQEPNSAQKLVFEFSGDPSMTHADVQELIHQLTLKNVHEIKGDIFIDDRRFDGPDYAAGTSYEDLSYYYAAPVNSIVIDGNAVDVD